MSRGVNPSTGSGGVSPVGVTDEQLAEIEQRANAATIGPWRLTDERVVLGPADPAHGLESWVVQLTDLIHDADAEFIAAARSDVPLLLRALRDARAETAERLRQFNAVKDQRDTAQAEADDLRRQLLDETYRPEGGEIVMRELRQTKAERNSLRQLLDRVAAALALDEQAVLKVATAQQLLIDAGLADGQER